VGLSDETLFLDAYPLWRVAFNTSLMIIVLLLGLLGTARASADGSRRHGNCEPTH